MNDVSIPDFDETELADVRERLNRRYGKEIELHLAEVEIKLDSTLQEPSWCPAVYWAERGANFVLLKIGPDRYRPMFYYQPDEQFGTGHESYDNIRDCVTEVLRVQADHEKESAGVLSGKTAKDLNEK